MSATNVGDICLCYRQKFLSATYQSKHAFPAWWGFTVTTAQDRQRTDALVRRGVRLGLYITGEPAPTQLINSADDALFERILHNPNHVLYPLLPDLNTTGYCLRQRRHDRILPSKTGFTGSSTLVLKLTFSPDPFPRNLPLSL